MIALVKMKNHNAIMYPLPLKPQDPWEEKALLIREKDWAPNKNENYKRFIQIFLFFFLLFLELHSSWKNYA